MTIGGLSKYTWYQNPLRLRLINDRGCVSWTFRWKKDSRISHASWGRPGTWTPNEPGSEPPLWRPACLWLEGCMWLINCWWRPSRLKESFGAWLAQGLLRQQIGTSRITILLFADDVALLASDQDFQHALRQSEAECEAAEMRGSSFKWEVMVLCQILVNCYWFGSKLLGKIKEFQHLMLFIELYCWDSK